MPHAATACALLFSLLTGSSPAQNYPTRPIRLLTPVVPGGGLDFIARLLVPSLSETLGKSVVVDNRPGASGAIALETTARAAPDGYKIEIFSVSQLILYAKANPGKLAYASSGVATLQQLAAELFASSVCIVLIHVPYKGIGAAYP